jgi:CTP synthase (UTP-ammonia lyase)
MIEIARNVLGYRDADHAESNPAATRAVCTALACSLVGQHLELVIEPASHARRLYGADAASEDYYCNYSVAPSYWPELEAAGVRVTARDRADGDPRVVELDDHPYFVATLFVPQARSSPGAPHPLIAGHVEAARRASTG